MPHFLNQNFKEVMFIYLLLLDLQHRYFENRFRFILTVQFQNLKAIE